MSLTSLYSDYTCGLGLASQPPQQPFIIILIIIRLSLSHFNVTLPPSLAPQNLFAPSGSRRRPVNSNNSRRVPEQGPCF